jgi:hypothetical protein
MSKVKLGLAVVLLALITTFDFPGSTSAVGHDLPFREGEKLTFEIKWIFIPAGEVVFEVLPMENMNGVKRRHFSMTARTYPFIDAFYKVRDRIDAYTDAEMRHSVLYRKKQEGKSKRDITINFDWEKREAQYSNFGEKRAPIPLLPGSFDPLSVFYVFRNHDLRENTVIEEAVTDGKKCVLGTARVVKREKIKVATRTFDTYLVEPDLRHIGGVFKKTKNAKLQIWITTDNRRFPVKVKSKLKVGSFIAELVSIESSDPHIKQLKEALQPKKDTNIHEQKF